MRVIRPGFRNAGHAVIAVAEEFDSEAVIVSGEAIEACEELVEHPDELAGILKLVGELGEAANVGEEDADARMGLNEHLLENELVEFSVGLRRGGGRGFLRDVGQHGVGEGARQDGEQETF